RNPHPFTGFDENDDIALKDLKIVAKTGTLENPEPPVQRPFHIVNTALNLTQGTNLAWQERKAASFVFTPVHCGFLLAQTQGDSPDKCAFKSTQKYAAGGEEV